jgi:transposase-like protein
MTDREYRDPDVLRGLYVERGLSLVGVADELDCHRNTVRQWMIRHDIERRDGKKVPKLHDEELLRELYIEQQLSTTEIADKFDCTSRAVSVSLNRHDIEARPMGEPAAPELADRATLREMYHDDQLSTYDIAERLDCGCASVKRWLDRHDIETRPRYFQPGSDNPSWKGGAYNYPDDWPEIADNVRARDGCCQGCGMGNGEHIEEFGKSLHVHHIRAARKFEDGEEGCHDPENLVTLCQCCHNKWEGVPVQPRLIE